jgi:hypothetical protein
VFHNIRFNTIKKGKYVPEWNRIIHQLANPENEMTQMRDGNGVGVLVPPKTTKGAAKFLTNHYVHEELGVVSEQGIDEEI